MNSDIEISQKPSPSRRKFVKGIGMLSMFAAIAAAMGFRFPGKKDIIACGPGEKKKTVKMLTQDGTLVEIDAALLTGSAKKITNSELKNWVKK